MDANSCANLNWLPKKMPLNTYLLLSTISGEDEFENLNSNLKLYYGSNVQITEIQPLTEVEMSQMSNSYLAETNRLLQTDQSDSLALMMNDTLLEKPTVFRSQLFLSIAKNLTSYQSFPKFEPTINGALSEIYRRLCAKHGELLTRSLLGLISIPRHGFTEKEILDILSGYDLVLDDVFQYHEPPIRKLPDLILKRILNEIDEYICRPVINGHRVIRYFHRQFHKFFKQYRNDDMYVLGVKFFAGDLAKEFPNRQIAHQKQNDPQYLSELPFLLLKSTHFNPKNIPVLLDLLVDLNIITKRIQYGQLTEYLEDCRLTLERLDQPKVDRIHAVKINKLEKIFELLQKKKNWLESHEDNAKIIKELYRLANKHECFTKNNDLFSVKKSPKLNQTLLIQTSMDDSFGFDYLRKVLFDFWAIFVKLSIYTNSKTCKVLIT